MTEPVRITKSATASDLSECLGWFGEEIQKRTSAQTREEVADALRDSFVDRSHTRTKYSLDTQDSIIEALRLSKETKGQLAGLADRFDNDGVPADFVLGIAFAAAMARDEEFEL